MNRRILIQIMSLSRDFRRLAIMCHNTQNATGNYILLLRHRESQ